MTREQMAAELKAAVGGLPAHLRDDGPDIDAMPDAEVWARLCKVRRIGLWHALSCEMEADGMAFLCAPAPRIDPLTDRCTPLPGDALAGIFAAVAEFVNKVSPGSVVTIKAKA